MSKSSEKEIFIDSDTKFLRKVKSFIKENKDKEKVIEYVENLISKVKDKNYNYKTYYVKNSNILIIHKINKFSLMSEVKFTFQI